MPGELVAESEIRAGAGGARYICLVEVTFKVLSAAPRVEGDTFV